MAIEVLARVDEVVVDDDVLPALGDEQEDLDEEPCYAPPPAKVRRPKYKPGTRQGQVSGNSSAPAGSWWTQPDADFEKHAERMRAQSSRIKVPGENNIIGWKATQ